MKQRNLWWWVVFWTAYLHENIILLSPLLLPCELLSPWICFEHFSLILCQGKVELIKQHPFFFIFPTACILSWYHKIHVSISHASWTRKKHLISSKYMLFLNSTLSILGIVRYTYIAFSGEIRVEMWCVRIRKSFLNPFLHFFA